MRAKPQLTHNAILYCSVGFQQDCLLQVLSIHLQPPSALEMVVYDGTVYAGASYILPHTQRPTADSSRPAPSDRTFEKHTESFQENAVIPRQLDLIKVKLSLASSHEPLVAEDLTIVERGITEMLGKEVLSLEEYMKRRKFINCVELEDLEQEPQLEARPNKKIKGSPSPETASNQSLSDAHPPISESIPKVEPSRIEEAPQNQQQMEIQKEIKGGQAEPHNQPEGMEEIKVSNSMRSLSMEVNLSTSENYNARVIPNTPPSPIVVLKESETFLSKKQTSVVETMEEPKKIHINKPRKPTRKVIDLVDDEVQAPIQTSLTQIIKAEKRSNISDMNICDLYERMLRFRILCRINHIAHFTSQKGHPCTKLMLIDENGDQILCMVFQKGDQTQGQLLKKGRVYFFQNGEVEKDHNGFLHLSVPLYSIEETKNILQSFSPKKMMRVGELQNLSSDHCLQKTTNSNNKSINNKKGFSKQLNVCGIYKGHKDDPKIVNNQFRIVGMLCDLDKQKAINFILFVDQLVSLPQPGTVLSLHNMHLCENDSTYRLQQSKRSYYLVQNHSNHPYFSDLVDASRKQNWKLIEFVNLSEVRFVSRTIEQLKNILARLLESEQCFSEIDCNIASVVEKREYPACQTCNHEMKAEKGLRSYCIFCKRIERVVKRFNFVSEVADSTGSIDVKVFSEEIAPFINMTPEEYASQPEEERKSTLDISSFQNILIKVKSQKKVGGAIHLVVRAEKMSHRKGLEQIKEQSINSRTSYKGGFL